MSRRVFHIELPIRSEWDAIEPLRESVLACLRAVFRDDARAEPLAMVAGELLENAVKYGRWDLRPGEPFTLRVDGSDDVVAITVSNPVDPREPGLGALFELLRRLREGPSAGAIYLDRLRLVASHDDAAGGLGLSRIAHEAGCRIEAELDAGDVLHVRAVTPRSAAAASSADLRA